jgi:hypothetical protein
VSLGYGLPERVDQEAYGRECVEVRRDGSMHALERHLEVVALDRVRVAKPVEVAPANYEPTVFLEATGRIERMDDRKAGHATGLNLDFAPPFGVTIFS